FLKSVLFFLVGLGMMRTRSQFAPAMSMQETIGAVAMHFMLHLCFKGLMNLLDCGYLSPFGAGEKGLQKGLFLLKGEIFMVTSAFGGLLDGCRSHAIVPGDDPMHRRG